ncbi:PTS system mannose/fructose/sorbose family transporter subunit IID [Desulfobaculum bizertense]|uniref:PTS system IID component, Man family (TC 4.A.6) n=1 Tax=Desulfobaculum bizertense DSM 18034 TaxID=1121442 RepID=A0A1T4VI15_9BACT|nr:PTS system mannose/fructose/sorbose family transporter subunit IID [Desulfobaculum bizertense]SKA64577.1 PTS system IID component, Man family (TC 4.A.6) [Desulfobaculum bizertense DSM 18034]
MAAGAQKGKTHGGASFPTARVLHACFVRTLFVGAGFNTRGMQNIGLAFAIDPGLRAIYGSGEPLRHARQRYVGHYNTHPFWTPLLLGIFLGVETKIARGLLSPEAFGSLRSTTIYALSAIGDSFFGGSILVFWSLATFLLWASGLGWLALVFGIACFFALQAFKAYTFMAGYRQGLQILHVLKKWDLINWGQRFKLVNALLVAGIWFVSWPQLFLWYEWLAAVLALGGLAGVVFTAGLSREVIVALLVTAYLGYPWLEKFLISLFA